MDVRSGQDPTIPEPDGRASQTSPVQEAVPRDSSSVSVRTMAECEQLFDCLTAPPANTLNGVFRGRLAAFPALDALPDWTRRTVALLTPHLRFPWYGKSFDGDHGANVWLTSTGRFRRFGYSVQYREQRMRLSYQSPDNPRFLRGLEAEIRELAPGRFLCRAIHRGTVVLYFTLEA